MIDWHAIEADEAVSQVGGNIERGLSSAEAAQRLQQNGPNELIERGVKSPWRILLDQFAETMVVILIIAAGISFFLGDLKDTLAIVAIVIINALLGFRQEYQAERAMAALKRLSVPTVKVRRDGHISEVSARELVSGDIVLLEAGNLVPADGRVIESINLRVQEAALTGESEPVSKTEDFIAKSDAPLADRHNMVYMGTTVSYGRGAALIVKTGMNTELGAIAELVQSAGQEPTPLQLRLNKLGKILALVALVLVVIVFVLGYLRGEDLRVLILTSIGMSVAAVPEGLPAVVTIALALGARRMLQRKALIRKLPAVETLGSVTVICSDKTGTLTENRMTVTVLDVAEHRLDLSEDESGGLLPAGPCEDSGEKPALDENLVQYPALAWLLTGGALCNDAILECDPKTPGRFSVIGDPTEGALVTAAAMVGLDKEALQKALPRQAEIPFDSERKRMTTIHPSPLDGKGISAVLARSLDAESWLKGAPYLAFTKGALDGLIELTSSVYIDQRLEPFTAEWGERIEAANRQLAQNGMRVLGVACRPLERVPQEPNANEVERDLIFIGLAGMIDPAREEVEAAVQTCKEAGIRPMMITGDHPLTALYIGKELGIATSERVVTGQELEAFSNEDLQQAVKTTSIFARVSPEHKLRIVQALQGHGEIVAMTGDGVNDAPALRKADIGVAMGITGTDVSKEAGDMVLLDDNFATIVAAVKEGRVIYDNIRKFIKYTMTSNLGEIWVMLLSPFLGMPLALLPLQILWINLVTDGLPGLALGVENPERNSMRRPPYPPNENIFARGVGRDILIVGFLMGIISLLVGFFSWRSDPNGPWQTMVFTTLTLSEMGYVMAIRSNRDSLFQIGPFSNRAMLGAVLLTTLLQIAVVYIPFFQDFLNTQALTLAELLVCFIFSTSLFWVVEVQKWILRRLNAPVKAEAATL